MSERTERSSKQRVALLLNTRVRPYVEGDAELCRMLDDSSIYDVIDSLRVRDESGPHEVAVRCIEFIFATDPRLSTKERLLHALPETNCDPVEWRLRNV